MIECREWRENGNMELWSFTVVPPLPFPSKKFRIAAAEYRARFDGTRITGNSCTCDRDDGNETSDAPSRCFVQTPSFVEFSILEGGILLVESLLLIQGK